MFGRAVFEVTEVKGGHKVKKRDFEAEKKSNMYTYVKNQTSNFVLMPYGYFPARNGSKLH